MSETLTLRHYRDAPIDFDRARRYEQDPGPSPKPNGFWVSVLGEDDWPSWCRGEEWGVDRLALEFTVTLAESANVLILDSVTKLDAFTRRFGEASTFALFRDDRYIRWGAVARRYDGIIVAPYQWSRRLDLAWYHGWDCASGCIWNLDAIASVDLLTAEVTRG